MNYKLQYIKSRGHVLDRAFQIDKKTKKTKQVIFLD